MKPLALMAYAGSFAIAGLVLAADATFTSADQNGDGVLSAAEVAVAMPDATPEAFDAADKDKSGTLSEDEFASAVADGILPES